MCSRCCLSFASTLSCSLDMCPRAVSMRVVVILQLCSYFNVAVICTSGPSAEKDLIGQLDKAGFAIQEENLPRNPAELDLISQLNRPVPPSHPEALVNHPVELDLISKLNEPDLTLHRPSPQSGTEHSPASLFDLRSPVQPGHYRGSTSQEYFHNHPSSNVASGLGPTHEARSFLKQTTHPILSLHGTPSTFEPSRLESVTAHTSFPPHPYDTNRVSSGLPSSYGFQSPVEHTTHRISPFEGGQSIAQPPSHFTTIGQEPVPTRPTEISNAASGLMPVGGLSVFSHQRPRPLFNPYVGAQLPAVRPEFGTTTTQKRFPDRPAELSNVAGGFTPVGGHPIFAQWTTRPYPSEYFSKAPAPGQYGSTTAQGQPMASSSAYRTPRENRHPLPNIPGIMPEEIIDVDLYETRREGKSPLIQGSKRMHESEFENEEDDQAKGRKDLLPTLNTGITQDTAQRGAQKLKEILASVPSENSLGLPRGFPRRDPVVGESSNRNAMTASVGSLARTENIDPLQSNQPASLVEAPFGTPVEGVGPTGLEIRMYKYINSYDNFRAVWMSCHNRDKYTPRSRAFYLSMQYFTDIEIQKLEIGKEVEDFVQSIMATWVSITEGVGDRSFLSTATCKMQAVHFSIVATIYMIGIMDDIFHPSLYRDSTELKEVQKEGFEVLKSFWISIEVPRAPDPYTYMASPFVRQNNSEKLEVEERLASLERGVYGHYVGLAWITFWHWMKEKLKDVSERINGGEDQKTFTKLIVDKVIEHAGKVKPDLIPAEIRISYTRIFKLERYLS